MLLRSIILLLFLFPTLCNGQKNKSALFVGNSYTYYNNLPNLIGQMATSQGHTFTYKLRAPGGASFSSHVQDTSWHYLLKDASYDYLILQGQSAELSGDNQNVGKHISPNYYQAEYIHQLGQLKDTCTQTMFFQTWGYQFSDPQDYLNMQNNVSASYEELAHTINAAVAPVGEAWRSIILNYPNLQLHSPDFSHPTLAGSYLAACVFYTTVYKESPKGAWHPTSISPSDALIFQETAFETVKNSLARWNINWNTTSCASAPPVLNNKQWEIYDTETNQPFQKLQFLSNEIGYAQCSFPHSLYATYDKGVSWDTLSLPNKTTYFDFHFVSDRVGFIASSAYAVDSSTLDSNGHLDHFIYPRLFKTVNSGATWQEIPLDTAVYRIKNHGVIYWTHFPNINIRFDDENRGTITYFSPYSNEDTLFALQTNTGGLAWTYNKNKLPEAHLYPTLVSADTIYIGSAEQSKDSLHFWRTINGGATWARYKEVNFNCCKTLQRRQYVHTVHHTSNGPIIANNLTAPWLLRAQHENANWDTVAFVPLIGRLEALDELDNGKLFGLFENSKNHRIATSADGGKTWRLDSYHKNELNALAHTEEYIYAAGKRGIILRKRREAIAPPTPPTPFSEVMYAYPNPANDNIIFQLPADYQQYPAQLTLFDISGKVIDRISLTTTATSYTTSKLASGIYFYQARTASKKLGQGKFIVQ